VPFVFRSIAYVKHHFFPTLRVRPNGGVRSHVGVTQTSQRARIVQRLRMEAAVPHKPHDSEQRFFESVSRAGGIGLIGAFGVFVALGAAFIPGITRAIAVQLGYSVVVALIALFIAAPLGFGAGSYAAMFLKGDARRFASRSLDMLGVVPSVLWAVPLVALLPAHLTVPRALLVSGIVLGAALSSGFAASVRDWLENVPPELAEQSAALGGRPWATFRLVVLPYVRTGLIGTLGVLFARALGEAILVSIVLAGSSVQSLAGGVAIGSAVGNERDPALLSMAALLLFATLPVQFVSRVLAHRVPTQTASFARPAAERFARFASGAAFVLIMGTFVLVCIWLVRTMSGLSLDSAVGAFNGLFLALSATLLGAPFGLCGAICIVEFPEHAWSKPIRIAGELLLSVPPIVVGTFVAYIARRLGLSVVGAGTLALSVLMAPSVMRRTTYVLRRIPSASRLAALELGATRARAFWIVVVGGAKRQLVGGVLAAVARTVGSTAALLFAADLRVPATLTFDAALSGNVAKAAANGSVLLVLVLGLKACSHYLVRQK
jgi:ABC-type phosphate transport system permease subunit